MNTKPVLTRFLKPVTGACIPLAAALVGCASGSPESDARVSRGYFYYCDGAGGNHIFDWSGGLRTGLLAGGYPGSGEIFHWNTGLGVVADQDASVEYKRKQARKLAQLASAHTHKHPGSPLTFIGLSAGTTVVVFSLEEMPFSFRVENVVLCSASISSTYDLTHALQHVERNLYVFTSEKDAVLSYLVPMAGNADRVSGRVSSAGLRGFALPAGASDETRRQYAKVVTIPWRPEFAQFGYRGGHTDVLSSRFVAAHIAPRLVWQSDETPMVLASTRDHVRNPHSERWTAPLGGSSQ